MEEAECGPLPPRPFVGATSKTPEDVEGCPPPELRFVRAEAQPH